jgi:enolase
MAGSDFQTLNAAITALTTQVAATETVEGSAAALLVGQAAAIQKEVDNALTADDAADQGSIQAANAAIAAVQARFTASANTLGAAVVANTPNSQPPVPASPNGTGVPPVPAPPVA